MKRAFAGRGLWLLRDSPWLLRFFRRLRQTRDALQNPYALWRTIGISVQKEIDYMLECRRIVMNIQGYFPLSANTTKARARFDAPELFPRSMICGFIRDSIKGTIGIGVARGSADIHTTATTAFGIVLPAGPPATCSTQDHAFLPVLCLCGTAETTASRQ